MCISLVLKAIERHLPKLNLLVVAQSSSMASFHAKKKNLNEEVQLYFRFEQVKSS